MQSVASFSLFWHPHLSLSTAHTLPPSGFLWKCWPCQGDKNRPQESNYRYRSPPLFYLTVTECPLVVFGVNATFLTWVCILESSLCLFTSQQPQLTAALPQGVTGGRRRGERNEGRGVRQLFVGRPRGSTTVPYLLTTVAMEPWREKATPPRFNEG